MELGNVLVVLLLLYHVCKASTESSGECNNQTSGNHTCITKDSTASDNNGVLIGSICGILAVVILSIGIAVCLYKRRNRVSKSNDVTAYNTCNSHGEVQTDRQQTTQNRQTNQHGEAGYAAFMRANDATGNSNEACQAEEESEYNHLNEVLVKPELENIYNVPETADASADSDESHYNNLNEVKRVPAIENEYGMADTDDIQCYYTTDNDYEYPSAPE